MPHFKINPKDLFFILKDQLNYGSLCSFPRYKGLSEKALDLLVTEAINFGKGVVDPLQEIGERNPPVFQNGKVCCSPEFKDAFRRYGRDGWIAVARDTTYGGQGFPHMMRIVVNDIMYGACHAFNTAPSLTHGAAHLIETFAANDLKQLYVPRCYGGEWSGTMCLTEPDAGSNLANIQTMAFREGDHFKIRDQSWMPDRVRHDETRLLSCQINNNEI